MGKRISQAPIVGYVGLFAGGIAMANELQVTMRQAIAADTAVSLNMTGERASSSHSAPQFIAQAT
jgi:hypothetical protein